MHKMDLNVACGSITSLIGPNGAGKTTFFNTITRLVTADAGSMVLCHGDKRIDLTGLPPHRIPFAGVARTFQNIRLFSDLSVLDNVKVGLHSRTTGGFFKALLGHAREESRITDAAIHYLDFVGLLHRQHLGADGLAYGEQRRLEIARALAAGPRLLLLDEPAAGMNPQETLELMDLILQIRRAGVSVLLIEHDMKLVMRISDHITCMDHGVCIASGAPESVRKHPGVIEAYLGAPAAPTPDPA